MKSFKARQIYLFLIFILSIFFITGCGGGGETGHWLSNNPVTAPAPPTVTNVAPLDNTNGVGITNTIITAQFSEPMAPITAANFTVACTTSCTKNPTGTVALNAAKTIATFTLTNSPLLALTTYTAKVTGAKSLATGLALASPYEWHFTTGVTPDTTRPSVTFTVPADATPGVPGVAINAAITAIFSEEMNFATLETASGATSFTLTCVAPCVSPVPGAVTYVVGSRTATFDPTNNLTPGTLYTATIDNTATDLSGNQLLSPVIAPVLPQVRNPWTFTTAAAPALDNTAPLLSSTNPANGAINVVANQNISATFNETMNTLSVINAFTLKDSGGNTVLGAILYDPITSIATFNPNVDLTPGATYTAKIADTATDLAGNVLAVPAVLPVPNPWIFTIAAAPIVPPPTLAINLRSAASFGIASSAGMSSTGVTWVNGDVALSPTSTCTDATGGGPAGPAQDCSIVGPTGSTYVSPTGMTINGSIYFAADWFDTGVTADQVKTDLNLAWVEGKSKLDTQAGVLGGELGGIGPVGKLLVPGVYHEGALGLSAGWVATLDGQNSLDSVFIFKVDTSFVDSGTLLLPSKIRLINGAQAKNVWFVVGLDVTIGHGTTWNGNILAGQSVTILDGSTVNGRVLGGAIPGGSGFITLTGAATPSLTLISVPE